LQTCIENFGDYWTMGPNWYVRYIVQADRSPWIPQRRARDPASKARGNEVESSVSMNTGSNNALGLVRRLVARRASVPLLTPLLVVALLLCHGAAGGVHEATLEPAAAHALPAEGHSSPQHPAKHSPSHAGYVAYLAAFFAVLLGVLIRPPVGMAGRQLSALPVMLRVAFAKPPLCRGLAPTAPSLQVFRL
jgi:hypothetical protein